MLGARVLLSAIIKELNITQLGLSLYGGTTDDKFGYSVSMNSSGDRIVIASPINITNAPRSGSVRVYSLIGNTWTKLGQDIDGEAAGDNFGRSVSINSTGDRIVVGAPNNDGKGIDSGSVRVYSLIGNVWTQLGQDIDGEAAGDNFGFSVSMNSAGNRIVVGAPFNDGNGSNSGSVRVYSLIGNTWTKLGGLVDIDGEAAGDYFGYSVSMNSAGDRIVVGAPYNDKNGRNSGSVRVYYLENGVWNKLGGLVDIYGEANEDVFGYSVSMNSTGDRIVVGAPLNDKNGNSSGAISVYKIS